MGGYPITISISISIISAPHIEGRREKEYNIWRRKGEGEGSMRNGAPFEATSDHKIKAGTKNK